MPSTMATARVAQRAPDVAEITVHLSSLRGGSFSAGEFGQKVQGGQIRIVI